MADNKKLAMLLAGLRGAMAGPAAPPSLPNFVPPGGSADLMPWRNLPPENTPQMPPVTVQAQAPQPAPPMPAPPPAPPPMGAASVPPMPPPQQVGPQAGFDPNDPRYLPEQWRGAFNPRWQS
jgi:hypothetical protein